MTALEIIDEYNRNIRSISLEEALAIYRRRIDEYKKEHKYSSDFTFLYPEVIGWNENWLKEMNELHKNIKESYEKGNI